MKPLHCETCGEEKKLHGHHDDYEKRLEVRWLCHRCHMQHHMLVRWAAGLESGWRKQQPDLCSICDAPRLENEELCEEHYKQVTDNEAKRLERKGGRVCDCGKPASVRGKCRKCAYREDDKFRAAVRAAARKYEYKSYRAEKAKKTSTDSASTARPSRARMPSTSPRGRSYASITPKKKRDRKPD